MAERFFYCRESWINGRLARLMEDAMYLCDVPEHEENGLFALGLLCRVGFAVYSDDETEWTSREIDEIAAPGFCQVLLHVGLAYEENGIIKMPKFSPAFHKAIYNEMSAARMKENRKKKKDETIERAGTKENMVEHVGTCANNTEHVGTCANAFLKEKEEKRREDRNIVTQNARTKRPTPADSEEVYIFMKNLPHCGLTDEEAHHCASKFYDTQEAIGWVGPRGAALRDWKALARSFLTDWQNNKRNAYTNSPRKTRPVIDPREGLFDDPDRF